MKLEPLHMPLENRPTVQRVCRHLNLDITPYQYSVINQLIFSEYVETSGFIPPKVKHRFTPDTKVRKYVSLFPKEYIPRMIEIINNYLNPPIKREKRPRIKKSITKL